MTRPDPAETNTSYLRSTLGLSLAANALLWAAFPPLGFSLLAWVAPAFWVYLIRQPRLSGRRPYRVIWGTSALYWFVLLEGIGRAYWANYLGLVVLSSYLATYSVLQVALSRVAVHRWKLSVVSSTPVIWVGLELARGHVVTGFSMALLGHTQVESIQLIQVADLFGAYAVSFVVACAAACLARMVPLEGKNWSFWPAVPMTAVVVCTLTYGSWRLSQVFPPGRDITIALIQGTEDTRLDADYKSAQQQAVRTFDEYWEVTLQACQERPDIQLIIWPESVFTANYPELVLTDSAPLAPRNGGTEDAFQERLRRVVAAFDEKTRVAAQTFNQVPVPDAVPVGGRYLLVGTDSIHLTGGTDKTYNAALVIDPQGNVVGRYYKMHRVMFGEYVPLGDTFPWLYRLMPIGRGLTPGESPALFEVHGVRMTPNICFESTVPHLVRRHVTELTEGGRSPDLLVNLTNDGWFWGSTILDLHLTCAVFRSVELRRPFVVGANTGLSASVDRNGVVRKTLPRREPGFIVADISTSPQGSFYEGTGDTAASVCLLFCLALAGGWLLDRVRARRE